MTDASAQLLRHLVAAVPAALEPEFKFRLLLFDSYDSLLDLHSRGGKRVARKKLLQQIFRKGRLVLSADAGTGKSSVGAALLREAAAQGHAPVRIDLRRWTPTIDQQWADRDDNEVRRMALLFSACVDDAVAGAGLSERRLRGLRKRGALVVVDGLNEVPPAVTTGVMAAIEAFAVRCPWAGVVVCDRKTRRNLPSEAWSLATIDSVGVPGEPKSAAYDSALLLEIARSDPRPQSDPAHALVGHIQTAAGLSTEEVRSVGEAALALYTDSTSGSGRFFLNALMQEEVGANLLSRLQDSGELLTDHDRAYFRHHLFHDALAAQALSSEASRWHGEQFDALTFGANSADAVALALEFIETSSGADRFVMAVYDWNLYAAAHAVSVGRKRDTIAVSEGLELALLAVLAERRWDPIAPSVQAVEDALRVSSHPIAGVLLSAPNIESVIATIASAAERVTDESLTPYLPILHLFSGDASEPELVDALDGEALRGWIAANVVRRPGTIGGTTRHALIALLSDSPSSTVRWRAAHALGVDNSDEAVEALFKTLVGDEAELTRYGAVRAAIEIAARSHEQREPVLARLRTLLPDLQSDRRVFGELQRALELRDPPEGWSSSVAPLIEDMFYRANSIADQDHWRMVGRRISDAVDRAREPA